MSPKAEKGWVVVSLGGSLIVPATGIAIDFLRRFKRALEELVEHGYAFVIVTGGGATARGYQHAAASLTHVPAEDLDWLGIHATRLNAHLLRTIFREDASLRIITNPEADPLPDDARVIIGAGWRPGRSTDYDAVVLAQRLGAKTIVNLSDVPYVYDANPREHPDAKPIERMTWLELEEVVGDSWSPGLNAPFDPVAAKECRKSGISVSILSGSDIANVKKALLGEQFTGTLVKG